MPIFQANIENYADRYPSILAIARGLLAYRHVDIDTSWLAAAAPNALQNIFPPGLFVYASGNFPAPNNTVPRGRLLPRAVTAVQANTGATSVTLRNPIAGVFRVGESISAATGFTANTGALTGAVALGNVTSIPLNLTTNEFDTINFSTPLAANLAAGSFIALTTAIPSSNLMGIINPNTVIDLRLRANSHFGVFNRLVAYSTRMPQPIANPTDSQLAAAFPFIVMSDVLP